ncbi:flagellar basal body P-ring protein FlgI [Persephonella atlantica]|uniref:Flagellar P-ring protein n=1 Tax=Persephonella atlantica TaxID=2699429 RepID=A0ABS1GHU3_9AQUI|nr:flagellar basal body P-ring protein FlgI [Persephonella atlantica]MBK3332482.1 flagellar basal body P-ring protein FlgI [Persephonella atlantica]
MLKKVLLFLIAINISFAGNLVKIKDEVDVVGVRPNYLIGYGIVVGLKGTGDGTTTKYTLISIANMLRKMGIYIDPAQVKTKNSAAVMVTANLPPFAKSGMRFDVTVASMGDAKDIGNGVLIRTPLFGPDGKVYAFAQGSVSTGGGFSESNKGGKITKNFPTTGIIVNGGIVERDLPFDFSKMKDITLILKRPDFSKAIQIQDTINRHFGQNIATALDATTVKVKYIINMEPVKMVGEILQLKIKTDTDPTIVIYERTGTVIMSGDIKIDAPVYVSHGNIYVSVEKKPVVSQPPPLSGGETVQTEEVKTTVTEEKGRIFAISSPRLKDLVEALNSMGVSPRDLIAIIQAIKNTGKLHAKIVIM